MNSQNQGLYNKYQIIHRETGQEVESNCFVLKPAEDPAARAALMAYAEATDNKQLAIEIAVWVSSLLRPFVRDEEGQRERQYKLLNGGTLIVTEEGCLFERASDNGVPLSTDADNVLDDVLLLLDDKNETIRSMNGIIISLQSQLKQANDAAAHWACKYHGESNLFIKQRKDIEELNQEIKILKGVEAHGKNEHTAGDPQEHNGSSLYIP